jgi:hypothetical protein
MFFVLCFTLWSLCVTSPIFGIVTTLVIVMDDAIALKVSGVVHTGFAGNRKGRAERYGGRKGRHLGRKEGMLESTKGEGRCSDSFARMLQFFPILQTDFHHAFAVLDFRFAAVAKSLSVV